ncbi:hypothetical protein EDC56_2614 [Sinobacterium caligoides]|uniref:Cation/multidrug efflux pump n=1 Tax=Sinobacterium caligoides TaxID=933926 RepID=A0A3N2DJL0_9GAMM|nr:cation/multidrug efflux pump [Sinobacterium caligoides]ROR99979.1 hypothetical protein EDC56_2614 [Sinobacterium caligoides]
MSLTIQQYLIPVLLLIFALVALVYALRMLWLKSWFIGMMRGMFGVALLFVVGGLLLTAKDLLTYKHLAGEQLVATLSFNKNLNGSYNLDLTDAQGDSRSYLLWGDQWQLDARVVKWSNNIPLAPMFRLERLSGRYFSIEQEVKAPKSVYALADDNYGVDVGRLIQHYSSSFPYLDATYGSATYMPSVDGALFEVYMGSTGLITRAINESAKQAVGNWQ